MAARFVTVDRDTQLLMPPDMRGWVPENHLSHFILEAVEGFGTSAAKVNHRGSGDAQYPPAMMLALLIYSYSSGVFSSRSIEMSTYDSVATRVLCADTHPDHDTICTFRRENGPLLERAFSHVLELAARVGVMKVGKVTVAIDGTKILANASKHSAVSYEKAGEMMQELDLEVAELLKKAEVADSTPLEDGLTVPQEIARREERKAKLQAARVEMEARAAVRAINPVIQSVETILIDSGFVSEAAVTEVETPREDGEPAPKVIGAVQRKSHHRSVRDLEKKEDPPAPGDEATFTEKMAHRTATKEGREKYKQRQQTIEPVFGIIKEAMGFRRFSLRGQGKAALEWTLVCVSYNLRRLHRLATSKPQKVTPAWA